MVKESRYYEVLQVRPEAELDIIKRRRLKSKLTKFLPTVGKFGTIKRWVAPVSKRL